MEEKKRHITNAQEQDKKTWKKIKFYREKYIKIKKLKRERDKSNDRKYTNNH